ncbi:MAG: endonuclease/exonuclease/phosphatase family protein [Sulfurospirillaceae bacterium]|nr:endonuclease/exonuclease/phosphatase family protein [Sulfurospirillaceae bacterium]
MRFFIVVFLIFTSLFAKDFKIATYNVQNLFDLKKNGNEYQEYIPGIKSNWNQKTFSIKLGHIARVIKDLNADIIALEEVENVNTAILLNKALGDKKYKYIYTFFRKDKHYVGNVVFSRYKVADKYFVKVDGANRGIDVLKFYLDHQKLTIYVNHWPAFKHGVKAREAYAKKLKSILNTKDEFVILGDLNAPYKTRQDNWGKSLVDTLGVGNKDKFLYNLWYELPPDSRYTYVYGRVKNALDHIILSKNLFDGQKIEYKPKSFGVLKSKYLVDKYGYPNRWVVTKDFKNTGVGYSDHLPIFATLQTEPYTKQQIDTVKISYLKKMYNDLLPAILKNVLVVRVDKYSVVLADGKEQIKIYLPDEEFEKGRRYDILVQQIQKYDRSIEISLCKILKKYEEGKK